jgi:hypothetical protein
MPCFLPAVEMNPRTECACQAVAFMISPSVAPLARAIMSRIFAPLLSARGAEALRSDLAAFLLAFAPALAAFLGVPALALEPLAVSLTLGAPFFWLGGLLRGSLLRRDVPALCRNGGGFVGSAGFCGRHMFCYPFLRLHGARRFIALVEGKGKWKVAGRC